jgi:hypothetical protein
MYSILYIIANYVHKTIYYISVKNIPPQNTNIDSEEKIPAPSLMAFCTPSDIIPSYTDFIPFSVYSKIIFGSDYGPMLKKYFNIDNLDKHSEFASQLKNIRKYLYTVTNALNHLLILYNSKIKTLISLFNTDSEKTLHMIHKIIAYPVQQNKQFAIASILHKSYATQFILNSENPADLEFIQNDPITIFINISHNTICKKDYMPDFNPKLTFLLHIAAYIISPLTPMSSLDEESVGGGKICKYLSKMKYIDTNNTKYNTYVKKLFQYTKYTNN